MYRKRNTTRAQVSQCLILITPQVPPIYDFALSVSSNEFVLGESIPCKTEYYRASKHDSCAEDNSLGIAIIMGNKGTRNWSTDQARETNNKC